ncbi:uncharacterized protein LOC111057449 isoform X1 [Nilaparvata lugens]|uniref:uncharacterized protein LOC111057449 isoform X1 n=1 Tax=Nilaparvata lugens TaxID=108931 RepID=UPI00193E8EFB|nr:uncharacterized protein LOC111057449 isoform X1 [Nilaparvata lugens]XP_039298375.1 uncharacterized protein LOC111057449 isoform X1 [Nilaparvata lugens]XP_039298376.1 uncharacterized protein LOC111057449 isoform X1 [Nilaparvata lugens]
MSPAMVECASILDAIQQVVGDTPGRKYHSLAYMVYDTVRNGESIPSMVDTHKLHPLLIPYCAVEAARLLNNHHMVVEALKSDDSMVIEKALAIKSFFNGSNTELTNPRYFSEQLIPHVSLNTRLKIIKQLSYRLTKPNLAEEFFDMFRSMYGIEQAMPLLFACSPEFIDSKLIEDNIVLTRRLMKQLYRKDPKSVIRYIKTARKLEQLDTRNNLRLNLIDYNDIIVKFIKVDIESFIEIAESYEGNKLKLQFSKNLGRIFIKVGEKYLIGNPNLYVHMLPLEVIDAATMRLIFPKLFPDKIESLNTNQLLRFLEFFPRNEKFILFERCFASRYNKKILETFHLVTTKLVSLLPDTQRVEQAKIMMAKNLNNNSRYYPLSWRCYCIAREVIPLIKNDIAKASQIDDRCVLIGEMIYCCKVNNDEDMLLDALAYFNERHKNETADMYFHFIKMLDEIYGDDLHCLSIEHWELIDAVISRMHVKGYFGNYNSQWNLQNLFKVLEASTHNKILHDSHIEGNMALLAHCNLNRNRHCWNILVNNPVYEEKCLNFFVEYVTQKIDNQFSSKTWQQNETIIVPGLVKAIYAYNKRHMKYKRNLNEKPLSVGDYPKLLKSVKKLLNDYEFDEYPGICEMKDVLRRNDKDILEGMIKTRLADVRSVEALSLLKREPKRIVENWNDYLLKCLVYWPGNKIVVRFIKIVRWHNDIAVKWREECEKKLTEDHRYLGILALLLDGRSFVNLVDPFMPKHTDLQTKGPDARSNYEMTSTIPSACNLVNPPVALSVISQYFEGDYLCDGLRASLNLCRRTAVSKVLPFVTSLMSERVSVRKHAIRLHYMVATIDESCQLLAYQWQTEKHHSIQEVLFRIIHDLFLKKPTSESFSLLKSCLENFSNEMLQCCIVDFEAFARLVNFERVPNQYLAEYVSNIFEIIEKMKENKSVKTQDNHVAYVFSCMDSAMCDIMGEPLCMKLIEKYILDDEAYDNKLILNFVLDSFILSRTEHSERRLNLIGKLIGEKVQSHWDMPRRGKAHYYDVNQMLKYFIEGFCKYHTANKINVKLVDVLLELFESPLKPKSDLRSYINLFYMKEKILSTSVLDFGERIAKQNKLLISEYSDFAVHLMSETIERILISFVSSEERIQFIEGLLRENELYNYYMAAHQLQTVNCYDRKFQDIMGVLLDCEYPIIVSIARQMMNSITEHCGCTKKY